MWLDSSKILFYTTDRERLRLDRRKISYINQNSYSGFHLIKQGELEVLKEENAADHCEGKS
jgi:hypothetical protein